MPVRRRKAGGTMNNHDSRQPVVTVYLLRHGQTAYNVADRLRGRADPQLNEQGRAQADALGQLFTGVTLSRVLASPLQRAIQTAEPLARASGLQVEAIQAFNDRDYGPWTGSDRSEVQRRFGSIDAAPGVEPWGTLSRRVGQAFDQLLTTSAGPAIAMVGHDATNRALLAALDVIPGVAPGDITQDNGCWNCLQWRNGRWQLTVLNAVPGDGRLPLNP